MRSNSHVSLTVDKQRYILHSVTFVTGSCYRCYRFFLGIHSQNDVLCKKYLQKSMKQLLLIFLSILLGSWQAAAQQKVVVRGRVTDAKTGEMLSDANVLERQSMTGMATNAYGLYSISLPKGKCVLQCSMLGYVTWKDTLTLNESTVVNIALQPDEYLLKGIEVVAGRRHSGQFALESEAIQALPAVGGEPDLMKSLQFLPGVQSGNEGANNLSVRGGGQWGNLVLLDEAVVYNPTHALSFFSVFNNDAIREVNLYKSFFPLKYGGRSSSVIDVRMREGNSKQSERSASIGLIASKLLLEGPLQKGKGSYLVSGRFGYPGPVASLLGSDLTSKPEMLFYDVNAKVNWAWNDRNRLFLSLYSGGDHTTFHKLVKGYGMDWGNATATLRWNHVLNHRTSVNTSAVFSNYYYRYKSLSDGLHYLWKSNMQSYQLKSDWETHFSNAFSLRSGVNLHAFTTMPGAVEKYGNESNVVPSRLSDRKLWDAALYAEGGWQFLPHFRLDAGLRLSVLHAPKVSAYQSKTYVVPEPRAELSYTPGQNHRFTLSYTQAAQSIHRLSTSSVGLPSDMWMPANALLQPAVMRQAAVGYEWNFAQRNYTLSVEAYVRRTRHAVDYKENADIFQNEQIESEVETGSAKGCGVELYLSKNQGALTGWLSYTLSRTRNDIGGEEYRPAYDRPHNLRLFADWKMNRHWSFSSTFSYTSGMSLTLPVGKYHFQEAVFYIYSARGGYRAPAFHELNLSATYRLKPGRSSLTLSVNNVYNRKNAFSVYAGRDGESMGVARIYKMYLYGVVPSLVYTVKF